MGWFTDIFNGAKKRARKEAVSIIKSDDMKEILEKELRKQLVDCVNRKINIPIMNEKQEAILFGIIYDMVTKAGIDLINKKLG